MKPSAKTGIGKTTEFSADFNSARNITGFSFEHDLQIFRGLSESNRPEIKKMSNRAVAIYIKVSQTFLFTEHFVLLFLLTEHFVKKKKFKSQI